MKILFCWICLIIPSLACAQACDSDYPPARLTKGLVPYIHPNVHFVEPPYAGFDPCNETVELAVNEKSDLLVIVLHGGAGMDNAQKGVGRRFQRAGASVLMFNAFKMNRLHQDAMFWATAVHAGSTGRMLYFSALASIQWAMTHHPERARRIWVYGVSTGGTAAIHLAATPGLDALKGVIAEGPNNAGIGLPDTLLKPTHIFYGSQDNYGGSQENEFLWQRRSFCLWNSPIYNMPPSNTQNCNYLRLTKGQRGQTVEEWTAEQKSRGAQISFKLVEQAAHGIFNGRDINSVISATPSGIRLYLTTGSRPGVADRLFEELNQLVLSIP